MNTKNFIMVSESRLKDAKEIFGKEIKEKGLKVYVGKETK